MVKEMTSQLILDDHPRSWNLRHSTTQASKDVFFQRYSWRWFKSTSFPFQLGWNWHLWITKVEKLTHWLLDALIGWVQQWFMMVFEISKCLDLQGFSQTVLDWKDYSKQGWPKRCTAGFHLFLSNCTISVRNDFTLTRHDVFDME